MINVSGSDRIYWNPGGSEEIRSSLELTCEAGKGSALRLRAVCEVAGQAHTVRGGGHHKDPGNTWFCNSQVPMTQ